MAELPNIRQAADQFKPLAEKILQAAFLAAKAVTREEQARIAWRMSDALWWYLAPNEIAFVRAFNDVVQDKDYEWVEELWTKNKRLTAPINGLQK